MGSTPLDSSRPFAVVTGASRGLGAAYARALAARGYDLLLASRDRARMEQTAAACRALGPGTVDCAVVDLAEPDAALRLHAAAMEGRTRVDLLVNNAGFGFFGDFTAMPMRRVREMLRVNVDSVVESTRLFLPGMIARGGGAVIIVSSVAGLFPVPYLAEYAATKAFLISFCEGLTEEVRRTGVRLQVCCPGSTETDFHATAGFKPRSLFGAMAPERVVEESLARLDVGPTVVTIGWQGLVLRLASRWVPHGLIVRMARRWTKPPARGPEATGQGE
jgi:hypothetical protein